MTKYRNQLILLSLAVVLAYLMLELKSWSLLFNSLTHITHPDELERRETFGYITVATGVTIFFFQRFIKHVLTHGKHRVLLIFLTISPFLFFLSYGAVFSIIEHSANFVAHNERPLALKASLSSLTQPDATKFAPYYFDREKINQLSSLNLAKQYISLYPTESSDIAKAYSDGSKLAFQLNRIYRNQFKDNLPIVYKGMSLTNKTNLFTENLYERIDVDDKIDQRRIAAINASAMTLPYHLSRYMVSLFLNRTSLSNSMLSLRNTLSCYQSHNQDCDLSYSDAIANIYYLSNRFGFYYSTLKKYDFNLPRRQLYIHALTNDKLGGFNNTELLIPPLTTKVTDRALDTTTFRFIMMNNAPFMLDKGKYIFSTRRIEKRSYLTKASNYGYRSPKKARQLWESYMSSHLTSLMENNNSWHSDWVNKSFVPLLRFSVVLPLMFFISSVLILFNGLYAFWLVYLLTKRAPKITFP
ncbi:MAG: hypothetical protein HAW67_02570 [Endozoicomonadaceae bacterium]|nr:hypothetical protein [Endozoicomonadaceae bacterium]